MKNNIITIVLIVVVLMIAVLYLTKNNNTNTDSALVASVQTSDSADAKYVSNLLQQMHLVKLDRTIFSTPAFQSLVENTVSFSAQPAGRNNPFSPVGVDVSTPGQNIQPATVAPSVRLR